MDYNKLKAEVSEFLGTIIDREHIRLSDDIEYDMSMDYDFNEIVDKIDNFIRTLEKRQEI